MITSELTLYKVDYTFCIFSLVLVVKYGLTRLVKFAKIKAPSNRCLNQNQKNSNKPNIFKSDRCRCSKLIQN